MTSTLWCNYSGKRLTIQPHVSMQAVEYTILVPEIGIKVCPLATVHVVVYNIYDVALELLHVGTFC